eukprot:CAMPEP_0168554466 /NCGR_PEP_ID=MMETSP0413-20121227/7794_1 /TAXON_ID=136452 /ORGANISM="Filamoeba nolandi, Strain NC-AS-23-1" /LENGTH=745 /DNA_ID=CAMNT_0008585207 /DNA_START=46 /DNA_END=2283 /DNA_ORIENTATION=-
MASPEAIMMEGLLQREWYKPKMSRQEAEDQLKNRDTGSFYVRPSTKPDHYALSYKTRDGSISHSLIQITAKGYKVPEETKVYPTLTDLLKACRFLKWVEPVSDAALAILIEAFPDLPQEVIVETLQNNRNNVEASIDVLLKKQEHNEIFVTRHELDGIVGTNKPSSPPKHEHKSKHHKHKAPKQNDVVSGVENLSIDPKPKSSKSSSPNTVLQKFMTFSNNEFTQKDVFDNWMNLPQKMSTVSQIPLSLETNLQKILRNPAHPMGKKIDTFVINFNASYQGTITNKDLDSKFQAAISDIQQFLSTLSSNIVSKVPEFNTPAGFIAVWRSSQTVIFPGIYLSLFQLFQRKFFDTDRTKGQAIQTCQGLSPAAFGNKYQGIRYSGISILQELSNYHGAHDKIATVTRVCQSIHKDITDHIKHTGSRPEPVNADDLATLFGYIIVQSGINSPYSELMFMKSFISDRVKSSLDGFALCVMETALEKIEAIAKQAIMPIHVDLLTDAPVQPRPTQPNVAPWPGQSPPMYTNNQNTYPNQYPPQAYSPQNSYPPQGYPPQGQPQGYPPQTHPPQSHPPQSYPPQNYPPQNFPPQNQHSSYNPAFTDNGVPQLHHTQDPNPFGAPTNQPSFVPSYNPNAEPEMAVYSNSQQQHQVPPTEVASSPPQASAPPPAFDTLKRVEKSYIQSLKTNVSTVDSHNQLAAYYSSKENYLKAIYHSKQALEIDPTNEIAKTNLIVFTKSLSNATAHAKYG